MKPPVYLTFFLLFIPLALNAQTQPKEKGQWDVYLAQYPKGTGSTTLDMSLKDHAPYRQWPYLVKTIIHFKGCTAQGFPDKATFSRLDKISDAIHDFMAGNFDTKNAGSFMYQCDRSEYFYVRDTMGVRKKLLDFFAHNFREEQYTVTLKQDAQWSAYLDFLYPNEETYEYMMDSKVVMKLSDAGDKLVKPRLVDHWAYFADARDRKAYADYIAAKGFNVEKMESFTDNTNLPLSIHFSRVDKADLGSITAITLDLRRQARKCHGAYDGWETVVIKD